MKKLILKSLLTIACLLCSFGLYAYDFEVDGIYYEITDKTNKTVAITYKNYAYNSYSGDIIIQETVYHNDEIYYVVEIGDRAFSKCDALNSVTLPNSINSLGIGAFFNSPNLTEVHATDGVLTHSSQIFYHCTSLKSIVIDKSSNKIYDEVFRGCSSLNEITIPQNITYLGEYALAGCTGLTEIRIEATTPPYTESNTFNNINKSIPVYVPYGCVNAYQQSDDWSEFTNIIESEPEVVAPQIGDKITVDGIYYQVTAENEVAVTYYGDMYGSVPDKYKYTGEVVIPESVTYKGITYSVTSIGENAFICCSDITDIIIPNSVSYIGSGAFQECNLDFISIPPKVTTIKGSTFLGSKISRINLPDGLISIESYAFDYCTNLKEIIIPNSVNSIGSYSFRGCESLASVTIGYGVSSIGDYAFSGCINLSEIRCLAVIPPSIQNQNMFENVNPSIPLYVPIGSKIQYQTPWIGEVWSQFTNIIECEFDTMLYPVAHRFEYKGLCYEVTVENREVKIIAPNHYYYDNEHPYNFINLEIPETISLGKVVFSVTSIGSDAFRNCINLTSISIPNSITEIGSTAFSDCTGLTELTIPNSVTVLGFGAFWNCSGLTSINIPDNIIEIGSNAFANCTGLSSIKVETGNTKYDSRDNCNAIINTETNTLIVGCKNTIIPSTVTTINDGAFEGCSGLTSIDIPNSVAEIGSYAFSGCTGLTELTIPESITSINNGAFSNCSQLVNLYYNAKCCIIDKYLSVAILNNCPKLSSVVIGNSVEQLPIYLFIGCSGLAEITCLAEIPPIADANTFLNVNKSIPVYVPEESVEAYRAAKYWSEFTNFQALNVIATSLTLDKEVLDMCIGGVAQISATVLPDNTTNKVVTWTSSDNEVATVDENGNVTAVSIGTATITATTTDGSDLSATCEVTVEQKMVKLIMQNSYYNNVIFFLLPGTEQKIQVVNINPMFVLNTVMFNDENVTEQLVDGVYTTPALEEDAVINISYDIPTAENTPSVNSRIKAYGYRGDVVVIGCERGETIAIYDVDGVMLRSVYATSDTMRIAMPTNAVYVVQVSDVAVKVAL